jgi:apolipoprotein D and lipocalin family protein
MMRPLFWASIALAAGGGEALPVVVPEVDLNRYQGVWYEIARYPNRFQNKCAGDVTATYELRPDGRIRVINRCKTSDGAVSVVEGVARLADSGGPASKLKVRFAPSWLSFLPAVWGDYWIIELAPDYSFAVVGHPKREYLWILARTLGMDDATYKDLLQRLEQKHGYDPSRLVRTRHSTAAAAGRGVTPQSRMPAGASSTGRG